MYIKASALDYIPLHGFELDDSHKRHGYQLLPSDRADSVSSSVPLHPAVRQWTKATKKDPIVIHSHPLLCAARRGQQQLMLEQTRLGLIQ
jgi:hypothetical protein